MHDAGGDLVGVALLLVGMLQKFLRHGIGIEAAGHEVVPLVAQNARQLGGQCLVQQFDHGRAVGLVTGGDGAVIDVPAGAGAQGLDVGEKGLVCRCSFALGRD